MTTTLGNAADMARAADLDQAHVAWSVQPWHHTTFGVYALDFLRQRGIELGHPAEPAPEPLECGEQPTDLLGLRWGLGIARPESPVVEQAVVAMSVEEIADLLAALAERDLHWIPGVGGPDAECGALIEGAPEPPDLHVVFDCFRAAWQRDDDRARDDGDPCERWFGPVGVRRTWAFLQRVPGPLTPEGGIAPTTPRDVTR